MIRFACLILLLILSSCSSATSKRWDYVLTYHRGDLPKACLKSEELSVAAIPEADYKKCRDSVWLWLDRGLMRFAAGNSEGAVADFNLAITAMDYCRQESTPEKIAQWATQDEVSFYAGDDFEQILARVYFALALLDQGDESNAFAILQQAESFQQQLQEEYRSGELKIASNPVAKYLLASVCEQRGSLGNASALYAQVGEAPPPPRRNDQPVILVLRHWGKAPYKRCAQCPASKASMHVLENIIESKTHRSAISTLPGVPIPRLYRWDDLPLAPLRIALGSQRLSMLPLFDLAATAELELEQKLPYIAARALGRILLRRSVVHAAKKHDESLGALVDFGMLMVNTTTQADLRSWATLPCGIDMAVCETTPGSHAFAVRLPEREINKTLHLKKGDLCVINIFYPQSGTVYLRVPDRFLKSKGDFQ